MGAALGLLIFATTVVVGVTYALSQPISFESSARIWVQPKLAEMVPSSYQSSLYAPLTAFFNSPIATAGEVLHSDVVLDKTVEYLRDRVPASQCPSLNDLRGGITVSSVSNADILVVRFRYKEPKVCQMALGALLDGFIKVNSDQSSISATQSRIFLEKQVKKAQQEDWNAREALKKFEDENHTLDFSEESKTQLKTLSDLDVDVNKAHIEMAQLRAKIEFLQGQLRIKPEDAVAAQRLALDDQVRELQSTIGKGEVRLLEYKTKFRENHPRVLALRNMIDQSKQALRERVVSLVGQSGLAASSGNRAYNTDPMQEKLLSDMVTAQADLLGCETKLTNLNAQAQSTRQVLSVLPAQQVKLAELTRAADVSKQILTDTERNLHSIKLLEAVASKASNIQILDHPGTPVPSEQKVSMSLGVSSLLGLLLGGATFLGVYLLNPAVLRIQDAAKLVPLPIMGWVNRSQSPTGKDILPGLAHLRINLLPWLARNNARFLVMSGDQEDGKTVVASGLAVSLAASGVRVLLVDLNFEHPSVHEVFELPLSPGMSEKLTSSSTSSPDAIVHSIGENLKVVTAGAQEVAHGTVGSRQFNQVLDQLAADSDVLILDTAAVTESTDAFAMMGQSAVLLLVIRVGHTYRNSLRLIAGQLKYQELAGGGLVFFEVSEQELISSLSMERPAMEVTAPVEEKPVESSFW